MSNVEKIIKMIDGLTADEKRAIYKKMQNEINTKLMGYLDIMNERTERDPISFLDITNEVEAVRGSNYEKA